MKNLWSELWNCLLHHFETVSENHCKTDLKSNLIKPTVFVNHKGEGVAVSGPVLKIFRLQGKSSNDPGKKSDKLLILYAVHWVSIFLKILKYTMYHFRISKVFKFSGKLSW